MVPVTAAFSEYAKEVQRKIKAAGFYCDVDLSARTLNKMVRLLTTTLKSPVPAKPSHLSVPF